MSLVSSLNIFFLEPWYRDRKQWHCSLPPSSWKERKAAPLAEPSPALPSLSAGQERLYCWGSHLSDTGQGSSAQVAWSFNNEVTGRIITSVQSVATKGALTLCLPVTTSTWDSCFPLLSLSAWIWPPGVNHVLPSLPLVLTHTSLPLFIHSVA